ncbi:MAG: TMEM165/GDT1 family protein [Actinomycetota bacterium]|nr:TMEM165/GDT1 family protein [Actinomycetota bacterium]
MHYSLIASTFAIMFLAELPDKSMISSIIMGSRLAPIRVFIGAAAAFLIQMIISVTVGGLVARAPRKPLDLVIGLLFLAGAGLIIKDMKTRAAEKEEALAKGTSKVGFVPQIFLAFVVTFAGEFGDLTQIVTANLAAKTADPISVGIGSFLGVITSTSLGIFFGSKVLSKVPIRGVQTASVVIMTSLGIYTIASIF